MQIHVLLGILCGLLVHMQFHEASLSRLVIVGVLGGLLPDIDHFFFLFWYGSSTPYAKTIKNHLRTRQIRNVINFVRINHKLNTSIYSHNIVSVILTVCVFWYLGVRHENAGVMTFFLSWCIHYVFDMVEDMLFFKRFNPNWFLKFNCLTDKHKEYVRILEARHRGQV